MEKHKPIELVSSNLDIPDLEFSRILILNPYPIGANCPIGIMMDNSFSAYMPTTILQYYTHPCEINKNSKFRSEQITLISPLFILVKNLIKSLYDYRDSSGRT